MEEINRRIKPNDSTALVKLTVGDQIKLLFNQFANTDVAELNANEKMSEAELKMQASLNRLFKEATTRMIAQDKKSVTLSISSVYLPYLDAVIDNKTGLGRFYDFEVVKQSVAPAIEYKFVVTIKRRLK